MTDGLNDKNLLSIIISLQNRLFAIKVDHVQTMVLLPAVSSIPDTPLHVRGIINLRGKIIPLVDLRIRLGMKSRKTEIEELISMLTQREKDHRNWINELELSVKEDREFKLATDHHLCAFGKWYDTFKTDNLILTTILKKFDEPHQRIHAIAHRIVSLKKDGGLDAAMKIINDTRNCELAEMIRLFTLLRAELQESSREIAVVLVAGEDTFAITVDSVEMVSRVVECPAAHLWNNGTGLKENRLVMSAGRIGKSDRLVLVLNTAGIFRIQDGESTAH